MHHSKVSCNNSPAFLLKTVFKAEKRSSQIKCNILHYDLNFQDMLFSQGINITCYLFVKYVTNVFFIYPLKRKKNQSNICTVIKLVMFTLKWQLVSILCFSVNTFDCDIFYRLVPVVTYLGR